jgi:phenylacetate-CoA ligase
MDLGELVRRFGFLCYDHAKGSSVSRQIYDLDLYFTDPELYQNVNQKRTGQLLNHACETVEYYNQYKGLSNITDFPIISKEIIKKQQGSFISWAFNKSSLNIAKTSGSYGTPMIFYQNAEKWSRRSAEVIYFNRWAGYDIGMKHALVRANPKKKMKLFLENELQIRPVNMDAAWLEEKWQLLLGSKVKFIISYPSVLLALTNYYLENYKQPLPLALKGIITYAEPIFEEDKARLEEVFRCPVLSRYSTEEFGVIAHQCGTGSRYHLNLASYHVEILALDQDRPAVIGEPGRVIITDLFSQAMPLIRYDTGDIAVMGRKCSCSLNTPVLDTIEGRYIETIYDTAGRAVSPLTLVGPISRTIKGILQFQFIQKSMNQYLIIMVVLPAFQKNEISAIITKLNATLGDDAQIAVDYVSSIPRSAFRAKGRISLMSIRTKSVEAAFKCRTNRLFRFIV